MTGDVRLNLIGDEDVQRVVDQAPRSAYRSLREFIYQAWNDHRRNWARLRAVRFAPRGRGVVVYPVGKGGRTKKNTVHYDLPKKRYASSKGEAIRFLQKFDSEIRTGSKVLLHHQTGGVIRAKGKLMPIPIRTRPTKQKAWRAKYPHRKLRVIPGKGGTWRVFEETGKGKRRKLRIRWALVRRVKNKPRLKFYETWAALAHLRDQKWAKAASDMIAAMEAGRG